MDNVLCKCGHEKINHCVAVWADGSKELICQREYIDTGYVYHPCVFEQDNLSFLEWKLEEAEHG